MYIENAELLTTGEDMGRQYVKFRIHFGECVNDREGNPIESLDINVTVAFTEDGKPVLRVMEA